MKPYRLSAFFSVFEDRESALADWDMSRAAYAWDVSE